MATIQKTTLKRYNGTDWDPVYLANSADISYLGTGFTVTKEPASVYTNGTAIAGTTAIATIIPMIVNNLAKINEVDIPGLADGSSITSLNLDNVTLTGEVPRENLPEDVSGKAVEVATEDAKAALTKSDVNIGDIVNVAGGKLYMVTGYTGNTPNYLELTDAASDVVWSRITDTPTTIDGYGITDAVYSNEKVTAASAANAGKILVLNANGKLDVDVTGDANTLDGHDSTYFAVAQDLTDLETVIGEKGTGEAGTGGSGLAKDIGILETKISTIDASWITRGTINIDRLPAASLERMHVVSTPADLANVTSTQAQNGDTIKVQSTGAMYYVIDDSKLGTADYMDGLTEYTAGTASAVDWSGVQNIPTDIKDHASNALSTADLDTNSGNVVTKNAQGKLAYDITGDAATLGSHAPAYFATQADMTQAQSDIDAAEGRLDALEATVDTATTGLTDRVGALETYKNGALATDLAGIKDGSLITALAASKLTGTVAYDNLPTDVGGRIFYKAGLSSAYTDLAALYASNNDAVQVGDLVKITDGGLYAVSSVADLATAAGYTVLVEGNGSNVDWSNIINKPTTVATSGLTDAVSTGMLADMTVVDALTSAQASKYLKTDAQGKLEVDITGSAAKLGGQLPSYYATASDLSALDTRVTTAEGEIDTLQTEIRAIDGTWITTGTISIDRLPHGALERCVVVADQAARFALTTADVQTGDTVKQADTGVMYFIVDDTKLNVAAGYEEYTAGAATSVPWSGVQNTPTTLAGYGITDAVNSNEKVTAANAGNAGKILVLNSQGKLDVDITGHVDWANINDKPTSTVAQIDAAVATATHSNRAVLDALSESTIGSTDYLAYDGNELAYLSEVQQVALGALKIVSTVPADAQNGQFILETIAG